MGFDCRARGLRVEFRVIIPFAYSQAPLHVTLRFTNCNPRVS